MDPLSGDGLRSALTSALVAAHAVLDPRPAAPEEYARYVAENHRAHLAERLAHDGRERRWPNSPFWLRRHPSGPGQGHDRW